MSRTVARCPECGTTHQLHFSWPYDEAKRPRCIYCGVVLERICGIESAPATPALHAYQQAREMKR